MEQKLLMDERDGGEIPHVLKRTQLIDAIISVNKTVNELYLRQFDDKSLRRYLDHLSIETAPRNAASRWVRERYEPAVERHESLD